MSTSPEQQPESVQESSPDTEGYLGLEATKSGRNLVPRTKEKHCYVQGVSARANTLCKRKRTLFNKGMMLNVKTKAEVLIIINNGKQRHVCGSDSIMKTYADGKLRPSDSDKMYKENLVSYLEDQVSNLGVCPLENAPDKLELDSTLAGVLGHSTEYTVAENPDTEGQPRSQRSIDLHASSTSALSEPVRQLPLNRRKPQLSQEEPSNIDSTQLASKITFISEDSIEAVT
ncbi:unnamed protein product [Porites evermanni]|uniref:MADS-box domain-containing protein n=1 Tax=Porites evermanni TaxID=104178 RepID=A0ABN8Q2G3_9CNID|nr:unnamed protein product [Porites evermanni]